MQPYTPEQQEDFQKRASDFQKEYAEMMTALNEKHQCEVKYSVVTIPSPSGVFGLGVTEQIGDLKFKPPVPSPAEFVQKDGDESTGTTA